MEIDSEEDTKKLSKLRDEKILQKQKLIEIEEENDKMKAFQKLEKRKEEKKTDKYREEEEEENRKERKI